MRVRSKFRLKGSVAALALGAMLAISGCNRANEATAVDQTATATSALPELPATLPLAPGAARDMAYAPPPDALPDVAPIRTVRVADAGRSYAYADAAYDFADALGDAPPDYAFDYDGVDPWAWQGYDDSSVFAEPLDDGYRYYYYRAGADAPYFVRDPWYGYGYDDGNLAVVYANDGAIVPWADYGPRVVYASRYLSRGRDLWRASRVRRAPVIAGNWNARRPAILQSRRAWAEARVQQPGWAAYRTRYNLQARDYWRPEAQRREADARRYAAWSARGDRGPPPPRAIPANWQRASWARDERRYAPVRQEQRGVLAGRQEDRRGDAFAAQRQQAIAAREQALAARQTRDTRQAEQGRTREQREVQIAARQQERAQREQQQRSRQTQMAERQQREQARAAQQAQRADAQRDRQSQLAERQQRDARRADADRTRQSQVAQRQQREQAQAAQRAQREQAQQARQQQVAERAQRGQAQQARQAQAAERAQRQQAQQAQAAERAQRQQAQQAQAAERAQRQQAQQTQAAERAQAQQARQAQAAERAQAQQTRQAQAAERAQRDQARQSQMAERVQAQQAQAAQRAQAEQARAARQQEQAARQQQRAERPRGGERER